MKGPASVTHNTAVMHNTLEYDMGKMSLGCISLILDNYTPGRGKIVLRNVIN